MAPLFTASIYLPDETATTMLGTQLATLLVSGDTLLLVGAVGAGKSHFARSIIQALLGPAQEVPSPTFTLVQTYEAPNSEIWHADLYRLSNISELAELGLEDAFQDAICLVEWADRLGKNDAPSDALRIAITDKADGREMTLSSTDTRWQKTNRVLDRTNFLVNAKWSATRFTDVAGDLSSRTYQRLSLDQKTSILMDAGDDTSSTGAFVKMTSWLTNAGYSAPVIYASDVDNGLLLLEDFGDGRLSDRPDVDKLMGECIALLADIRAQDALPTLPCPSSLDLSEMTALASYYPGSDEIALRNFRQFLEPTIKSVITNCLATVSLRDFHTDNIMWLADRNGIKRLGLLDYQDAFLTHPVYDLMSLLTDARRDVTKAARLQWITEYARQTGDDLDELSKAFSVFSVQRNLRILGIFARAAVEQRKNHHVQNVPRVYAYLAEALNHPIFNDTGPKLLAALPKPDDAFLKRLAA